LALDGGASIAGRLAITSRLEALPATRGFWRRMTLLSLGGFFEFYDLFLAAYVAPGLVKSGILTATTPGLLGTTGIAGFVACRALSTGFNDTFSQPTSELELCRTTASARSRNSCADDLKSTVAGSRTVR